MTPSTIQYRGAQPQKGGETDVTKSSDWAQVVLLFVIALAVSFNAYTNAPTDLSPKIAKKLERQAATEVTTPTPLLGTEICAWVKVAGGENGSCAIPDASGNLLTQVQTSDGQVFEIDFRPVDNKLRINVIQPGAYPTE